MTRRVEIILAEQTLSLLDADASLLHCKVATAKNGSGERMGSARTPRGVHEVAEKIGAGCPPNTVFVGRRPSGECYSPELGRQHPGRDWILTRILWLAGREPGRNLGGQVDSRARYIYIHGCPDEAVLGTPGSGGCIRMRNEDVIQLFDLVEVGTEVVIRQV